MIYFLIYLFLEVMVSVNISSAIGALATFLEVLLSALLGIVILMNFRGTLVENLRSVSYSCIDLEEFQKLNLFTLLGAFLLIIPGFLTDILGLLLQFSVFTSMLVNRLNLNSKKCNMSEDRRDFTKDVDDEIIDVEVIEHNTTFK